MSKSSLVQLASATLLLLGLEIAAAATGGGRVAVAPRSAPSADEADADGDEALAASCSAERPGLELVGARAANAFKRACVGSATFRALLHSLGHHAGLAVKVEVVSAEHPALASPALRGQTRWIERGPRVVRSCGTGTHTGRIACLIVGGAHEEAYLGHELRHALELAECGDIRRAPTVRGSRGERDLFDTERARETERAIRGELAN